MNNEGSNPMERAPVLKSMDAKSKTRASGRCCICFDSLSIQGASMIVFFCCHAYHLHCLTDSTNNITTKKGTGVTSSNSYANGDYIEDEDDENDQDTPSGGSQMRCVLCTTAAGG
ncbi:putative chromatin regulator PHD family [Helianthus annuus]|nr:putative chromatin regulator PHD family [Helianthus annuus]KAJ0849299.1 putative chromatin regulator PHD family [Helianthus annuus]